MPNALPTMQVRLENTDVRGAVSPTDVLLTIIPNVTLSGSAATIDIASHINHAEVISYWYAKTGTTTYDGTTNTLATSAAVAGATATVDIIVLYRANKAQ